MNEPRNKDNFLIEVTPEQLEQLNKLYQFMDEDGYVEMHYSPYWKEFKISTVEEGEAK